jgi:hypothetical protein
MSNEINNGPRWDAPALQRPVFQSLSDEEAAEIRGGKWRAGTCAGVGYACSSSGGFHGGICIIVGYTT